MSFSIEDYQIEMRRGRSYLKGKDPRGKNIYGYLVQYQTKAGLFTQEEWKEKLAKAIEDENESELLEKICQYCKSRCAWLHTEQDLLEYSMDILAGRVYEHWKDFGGKNDSKKSNQNT